MRHRTMRDDGYVIVECPRCDARVECYMSHGRFEHISESCWRKCDQSYTEQEQDELQLQAEQEEADYEYPWEAE